MSGDERAGGEADEAGGPSPPQQFPLALEFVALAAFMAKEVQKLPPELWPPAVAAADGAILLAEAAVVGTVNALPSIPSEDSPGPVTAEAGSLVGRIGRRPDGATFAEAGAFIASIQRTVDPIDGPVPDVPHMLSDPVIDAQATMLVDQFNEDVAE